MINKTFRRIAATTVALASILSASAAFAENGNWPRKGPANLYLPGAPTQLDTGSAPQATASAAPSGMSSDRDLTGRTSTTSISSTWSSNPYATFANPYGTITNPYDCNLTTDGSGH